MMLDILLTLSICVILLFLIGCLYKLRKVKQQLFDMTEAVSDIRSGNGNRRILVPNHELTADLAYKINDIVYRYEEQLMQLKVADEANRQLMTSLSHDVRTPLTTLIGYLDAIHRGVIAGQEREEYFEIARHKAHHLKEYIDTLFDWFKQSSSDFTLQMERVELSELTRNILKDWIPIFEENHLNFEIEIPDKPLFVKVDKEGYARVINNLVQNVTIHSHATQIRVAMERKEGEVAIRIEDNGVGIEKLDLEYIFERLYKCDKGRSHKGSGLGLSIVHQMVEKMEGRITVQSEPGQATVFTVFFPERI